MVMDGKMLARLGAVVFVAVAVTATAIEMTRKEEVPAAWPSGRSTEAQADPLRDELIRCQSLGEAGPRDPGCLRAWAENRHRFLAPGARPMERLPQQPPPNGVSREIPDNPIRRESAPQPDEAP
jgi:conjugative transfer region protein TrbK